MLKLQIGTRDLVQKLKSECGQDSVEYAIMIGIVALAAIASVGAIATYAANIFSNYAATL